MASNTFEERIRIKGNPVANPAGVVTSGQARFTVLTRQLLRLEWSSNGEFEDRATFAFPNRYVEHVPAFTAVTADDGVLTIDTGALTLLYKPDSGFFTQDNLQISFQLNDEIHYWQPGMTDPLNLGGTYRTLDMAPGDVSIDPGLLSRAGWTLFDDSKSVLLNSESSWVEPQRDHDLQDWYFFGYGHEYKAALYDYTKFGGTTPLIPKFVLGAWWSRYWAYSDQDLKDLVLDFEKHDLPLDVLVVDMDWHTTHSWTGYSWNRELFPDPAGFLQWVHQHGLRTTLNLHPAEGVQAFEDAYQDFAKAMSHDTNAGAAIPFHITDPAFTRTYFELLHHPLEEQGIDFWWMDWQQGETSEMKGLDPLIWLNHLHFQDSQRRGIRPMLYSRWGGLGNHRYYIGFSGDTYATWESLQFQPYFTAAASNVGYGWWSHDIGGHIGATEPEMYARWVQYGALSPCLRLHSTKDPMAERRPWAFAPEVYEASRDAFQLRYRLIPYLYTYARVNTDTGVALCRPMYYDYPENEAAYAARYQYLLGDEIIAAPIVFPADPDTLMAASDVWIPEGTWIEYTTKETFVGPAWVRIVGDLKRIPMLVKAGAIVPEAPLAQNTDSLSKNHLNLRIFVYPNATRTFRLYEDDGTTQAYETGQCEWTNIVANMTGDRDFVLEVSPVEGHCEALPNERYYEIYLEGVKPLAQMQVIGATDSSSRYDADTETTIVTFHQPDKTRAVRLVLSADKGPLSVLTAARNQTLVLQDVERLLGDYLPAQSDATQLTEAIIKLPASTVGRTDAIARLGGPFVRVIEYTTPRETAQQLATLIVAAPAKSTDCAIKVTWTLFRNNVPETFNSEATISPENSDGGLVVQSPFAIGTEDKVQSLRWSAEISINWDGTALKYAYQSRALFPAIYDWRAVVFNRDEQPNFGLKDVLINGNEINPALNWQNYQQEIATALTVEGPYHVPLHKQYLPRLKAGEPLEAYVVAVINSPEEREARLEYRIAGPAEFYLNGQLVEEPEMLTSSGNVQSEVYNKFQHSRHSDLVRLQKGVNTLVIYSKPPTRQHWWWLSVAVVRPDGALMDDLTFDY